MADAEPYVKSTAGREDRLQRVRGDDEEREPRPQPQEAARRRAVGEEQCIWLFLMFHGALMAVHLPCI